MANLSLGTKSSITSDLVSLLWVPVVLILQLLIWSSKFLWNIEKSSISVNSFHCCALMLSWSFSTEKEERINIKNHHVPQTWRKVWAIYWGKYVANKWHRTTIEVDARPRDDRKFTLYYIFNMEHLTFQRVLYS